MTKPFSTAKPSKAKRRKSATPKPRAREPTPDEVLYEIRDILDEKIERGKLLYKVDWADNPTTGERYDPSWEPAENVTEAAVADWEREKRRRQGIETQSSVPSIETDSQPVLPPNWRAKRRRESSASEQDHQRPPKRSRGSVDSGYTSTDGDPGSSWATVQSSGAADIKASTIVLEIARPPGFDPAEYQYFSSSQSAPSSQTDSATLPGGQQLSARISQRTVPDSQEGFESLRTQFTTQSTTQSAAPIGQQTSLSDLNIPSRQPESSRQSGRSSGLLESQEPVQEDVRETAESPLGGQGFFSADSPFEGFLTQPNYASPQSRQESGQSSGEDLVRESSQSNLAERVSFLNPAETHPSLQAAQRILLLESNPGFLTQISDALGQHSSIVPETVGRPTRPAVQPPSLGASSLQAVPATTPITPAKERSTALPYTPQNRKMDGVEENPRPSAAEMMRQLQASVFGSSPAVQQDKQQPPLVSPSAVLPSMGGNFAEHLEAASVAPAEHPVVGDHTMVYEPPATVAPADLTTSVEHISSALDGQVLDTEPISPGDEPDQTPLDMVDSHEDQSRRFTVTLPMAANTRATYLEMLSDNKAPMIEFGESFTTSPWVDPEPSLVAKIDSIFERLLNLCNLPAYDQDLPDLGKGEMMKHATNSNSKFSFVYEFLNGLWEINPRILVLSQPGRVFDYLEAVVSSTVCPYTVLTEDGEDLSREPAVGASVILAVAGQDLSRVQPVDVVIAFDHTARSVELPATLGYESMAPIVLSLVATYSLDHIEQQLAEQEQDLDSLERRNALNLAITTAIAHLRNPHHRQYIEPHEAAKTFADFLRNPEMGLDWEPHPLPADVFEIWLSSQERTQLSQSQAQVQARAVQVDHLNGLSHRKRPLDNIDEGTPKRPRIFESQQPSRNATPARMSDLLRQTLAKLAVDARTTAAQVVEVPVDQLERMSDKIAELERRLEAQSAVEAKTREHCTTLETELQSYKRTVQSLEPKYMDALRDRATFEKQCQKAVERLAAQTEEMEVLKQKNKFLEAKLAEATDALANSSNPDLAKLAMVEKLEKKIQVVQNEVDYSRKAYQDASNAHTELNQEHQELKAKVAELERQSSENLLKIHQLHAQTETAEASRQIDELQATLENRERELERAKEELKYLKSGRRETRQGSVPRSPRTTAMMSPRPARGTVGGGGAGSRGTSPAPLMSSDGPGVGGGGASGVPGMTLFPSVAGNGGRWGHLRD